MTEAQKPAPSRLLPWVVAIGLGIPLALIALAASPLGPNFVYVVVAIPALLFLWVIAGLGAFIVSIRSAMQKEMEAMCHRRHSAGRSVHCRIRPDSICPIL
jgi:hypothetical protein